ncbi:MAG: ABC transporter permease [Microbacteriaceae bacterium]
MIFSSKNKNVQSVEKTDTEVNILADINQKTDVSVKTFLARLQRNGGVVRMLVIAITVFAIFSILNPNVFLKPINLQSIASSSPEIGILAIAMMIAMLTAGIDLSVISIANLTTITIASLYKYFADTDPALAEQMTIPILLIGIAVGLLAGLFNGFLIGVVGITPILATLGTMLLYNGLAIVATGGATLHGVPEVMTDIGQGNLFGVPNLFILLIIVAIIAVIIVTKTPLGVKMRLLGANDTASLYSGLANKRILIQTYLLTGGLASIAGLAFIARNPTANADYGTSYLLLTIVIVVLGGTNPNGGYATVTGVVLATLTLQMISSGFNMMRLSSYEYQIAQGLILVLVMVIDQVNWRKRSPKKLLPTGNPQVTKP